MKIITIIPAAGKGTRVNLPIPKILIKIGKKRVIDLLIDKVKKISDKIIFIINPKHKSLIKSYLQHNYKNNLKYKIVFQKKPLGMYDAIFKSINYINDYKKILIIWGDHVGVEKKTIFKICKIKYKNNSLILPLILKKKPYVEYIFIKNKLDKIKESREGDTCSNQGLSDVGTFLFHSINLTKVLKKFKKIIKIGIKTKEQNFLPFITYLSKKNWNINKIVFKNSVQSDGINTKNDIVKFKMKYK